MGQSSSSQEDNNYNNGDTSWTEINYETQTKKRTLKSIRKAIRYETNAKIIQSGLHGYLVRKKINRLKDSSKQICSYLQSYQVRRNIQMILLMLDIIKTRQQINERKTKQSDIIKGFIKGFYERKGFYEKSKKTKQSDVIKGFIKGFYERSKTKKSIKAYSLHQESKSIVHYRENVNNNLRNILFDWKRQIVWQKCIRELELPETKNEEITLSNNYITDGYKLMYRFFDNWHNSIDWTKYYMIHYYFKQSNLKYGFRAFKNYIPDRVIRSKKNKRLKLKLADTIYKYNLYYKTLKKWKSINF